MWCARGAILVVWLFGVLSWICQRVAVQCVRRNWHVYVPFALYFLEKRQVAHPPSRLPHLPTLATMWRGANFFYFWYPSARSVNGKEGVIKHCIWITSRAKLSLSLNQNEEMDQISWETLFYISWKRFLILQYSCRNVDFMTVIFVQSKVASTEPLKHPTLRAEECMWLTRYLYLFCMSYFGRTHELFSSKVPRLTSLSHTCIRENPFAERNVALRDKACSI